MSNLNDRNFQVGDYWLSKNARSQAWCRTWYDATTKQTRRTSLRTADFEQAKILLTEWFIQSHQRKDADPADITLAEIFSQFYEKHASKLQSAYQAQLSMRYWLDFHGEATVNEAAEITAQERFHVWLAEERNQNRNTINRVVSVGKTALSWAWKRGILKSTPYIMPVARVPSPPRGEPLEIAEIVKLIRGAKSPHIQVFIILGLATGARPDAIFDLTFDRCDRENGIITLNPPDRQQTKKYRPVVKLPPALVSMIDYLDDHSEHEHLVTYKGQPVESIKRAWRLLRKDVGLDHRVNPYSLRHTVARWLRKEGVPAWEVAAQLGHKSLEFTTTEIYAPFDPSYLSNAVEGIDKLLQTVSCELRVSSLDQLFWPNRLTPCNITKGMVGDTGIEPVTPTMSM